MELNPFGWWPLAKSRIAGLGGAVASSDPAYVFHTPYQAFSDGNVLFTVTFSGLRATRGRLQVRLNAIGGVSDGAVNVKTLEFDLAKLAASDRPITFSASARDGRAFAVFARLVGDTGDDATDAAADDIGITVEGLLLHSGPSDRIDDSRRLFAHDASDPLLIDAPATLHAPYSQMCTSAQFDEEAYRSWVDRMNRPLHRHRKQWEFVYICAMLERMDALRTHARGLGFGCGREPLPAVFASFDIFVTASDLSPHDERSQAWAASEQLGMGVVELRDPGIVDVATFDARVEFEFVDMTRIPDTLRDYDFTWSSCALEHLGSIDAGMRFFERSLDVLRPGGVAVHTTELNLVSDDQTIDHSDTVLFRRKDILGLARRLTAAGHHVMPITFDIGDGEFDTHVDYPPYGSDPHLKLALGKFITTSFGLAVRKAG